MAKCQYAEHQGCTADATHGGFCLPHGVLFYWLIHGDGTEEDRLVEHDAIASLPVEELARTLRNDTWDPRIRKVLGR